MEGKKKLSQLEEIRNEVKGLSSPSPNASADVDAEFYKLEKAYAGIEEALEEEPGGHQRRRSSAAEDEDEDEEEDEGEEDEFGHLHEEANHLTAEEYKAYIVSILKEDGVDPAEWIANVQEENPDADFSWWFAADEIDAVSYASNMSIKPSIQIPRLSMDLASPSVFLSISAAFSSHYSLARMNSSNVTSYSDDVDTFDDDTEEDEDEEEEEEDEEEEQEEEKDDHPNVHHYARPHLTGMKSFRFLETQILAKFIKETDDERMNSIRRRIHLMKKVKAPVVRPIRSPPKQPTSLTFLKEPNASKVVMISAAEQERADEIESKALAQFTNRQWAIKNAEMFLKTAGCKSPPTSSENIEAATIPEPPSASPKLRLFNSKVGKRRRMGIGNAMAAPEITAALKRMAERSAIRAILAASKPKYPLPRFILPRHHYLKKVDASMIGPGSYEHDYFEKQRQKRLMLTPSPFRSCTNRFSKDKEVQNHPGSTVVTDPYEKWEAACYHNRHPCKGIPFESTPCNFRYKDFFVGCGIPPNAYNIRSHMQDFLDRQLKIKGMYDESYTADLICYRKSVKDRDSASRLGPGSYEVRASVVKDLEDPYSKFKGKFSKTERSKMLGFKSAYENPLWPVEDDRPAPTSYNPYEHEELIGQSWVPFGNQAKARESLIRNNNSKLVTSDYYYYGDGVNIDKGWIPDIFGGGSKYNFESKSPMTNPDYRHNFVKERNQARNWKLDQELLFGRRKESCDDDINKGN